MINLTMGMDQSIQVNGQKTAKGRAVVRTQ